MWICKIDADFRVNEAQAVNNTLTGLSGRILKLGSWKNPTGIYRLGLKHSDDLFPKSLVSRLQSEKKERFDIEHHKLVTKAQQNILTTKIDEKLDAEKVALTNEMSNRARMLDELKKNYEDPGILIDCVVFNDGEKWRAAIDFDGTGDLTRVKLLTDYRDEVILFVILLASVHCR